MNSKCNRALCSCEACSASRNHRSVALCPSPSLYAMSQGLSDSALFAGAHPQLVAPPGTVARRSRSPGLRRRGSCVRRSGAWSRTLSCKERWLLAFLCWRVVGSIHGASRDGTVPARHSMWALSARVCSVLRTWLLCTGCSSVADHICLR